MKKSELSIPPGGCQQVSAVLTSDVYLFAFITSHRYRAFASTIRLSQSNANLIYADTEC
jgi:hypothetical protein